MNTRIEILKGTPPGKVLEHDLNKRKIKKAELARRVGVTRQMIGAVISGRRDLSLKLSLRIERELDYEEGFLQHLQTYHKIDLLNKNESQALVRNKPDIRKNLFWDYDYENLDWIRYKNAIIHRVLERGTDSEKREIARFYRIPMDELDNYRLPEKYYRPANMRK